MWILVLFIAPPFTLQSGQGKFMPAGPNAKQTSQTQLYAGTFANPTHLWCRLMLQVEQNTIKLSSV